MSMYRTGARPIVHAALRVNRPRNPTLFTPLKHLGNFRASFSHSRPHRDNTNSNEAATRRTTPFIFSANQPAELPSRAMDLKSWSVTESKMGITRRFTFPTFSAAWRFMSLVAEECKLKRHHPCWHNLYNQVTIEWTTHKPKGLSMKDIEMAEFCDRMASDIGLKNENQANRTNISYGIPPRSA